MKITTVRRISQTFFLLLFFWFCFVMTLGERWYQLRGWPVNWFLQLDPLAALGTLITTGTLFRGMVWAVVTIALTAILGRFFCGWLCPFGTLHQLIGYLAHRKEKSLARAAVNQPHRAQRIKYYILIAMLAGAALHLLPFADSASLQTGLLDPIPLLYRSVNLMLLPFADGTGLPVSPMPRFYEGAFLIGAIFLAALFANLWIPRFYCRFVCPLGALFGLISRYSLFRVGQREGAKCTQCHICEKNCEGACAPGDTIRIHECVLCMNCLHTCSQARMTYSTAPSAQGEIRSPDLSRRGFLISAAAAGAAIPSMRLSGALAANWNPNLIRPPGALAEADFLHRCIKCGQCMRICPTNIIHPAGFEAGWEGIWTPILNFRIGTSGCQKNCIACGNICPTAAIRPITIEERLGTGAFAERGPLKTGMAFVDRGRCLPWAMNLPCIVCQENCPVSPKAIVTDTVYALLHEMEIIEADGNILELKGKLEPGQAATGDYFCTIRGRGIGKEGESEGERGNGQHGAEEEGSGRIRITANTESRLTLERKWDYSPSPRETAQIRIRLQRPVIAVDRCIGCGVCEHECPVRGLRAVRVTAENESRNEAHLMLL